MPFYSLARCAQVFFPPSTADRLLQSMDIELGSVKSSLDSLWYAEVAGRKGPRRGKEICMKETLCLKYLLLTKAKWRKWLKPIRNQVRIVNERGLRSS